LSNLVQKYTRLTVLGRNALAVCLEATPRNELDAALADASGRTVSALLPDVWHTEDVFVFRLGACWYQGVVTPLADNRYSVVLIDVTAYHDGRQSAAEIDRFAYAASHDLQEPLRKIRAFSDRLQSLYAAQIEGEGTLFLNRMRAAVERMQAMLDGLLAYSRAGRLPSVPRYANIHEALEAAWSELGPEALDAVLYLPEKPLPQGGAYATALQPVFRALFDNALKFRHPARQPGVSIQVNETAGKWVMCFQDNGIGFESAYAERIFNLFERLNAVSAYSGAGLGLAIARKTVEALGGALWAEGTPDKGAVFFLELPVTPVQSS